MFDELGHYFLVLSISVALTYNKKPAAFSVPPYLPLSTFSFSGFLSCFISSDFPDYNVFINPNAIAPLFYKISGTRSDHEGSLLPWCRIPSFYGFLSGYRAQSRDISKRDRFLVKKLCSSGLIAGVDGYQSRARTFISHFVKSSKRPPGRVENPTNLCSFTNRVQNQNRFAAIPPLFRLELARGTEERASFIDEQRKIKGIALFFSISLSASPNPSVQIPFVRTESLTESNPVPQDLVLAIHPPHIYAGYVAGAIGFCSCLSRVMNGISAPYSPIREEDDGGRVGRKRTTLCPGEVHITSKLGRAFSFPKCHPGFAPVLHSNRSLLIRCAPLSGPLPRQGALSLLWPGMRLERTETEQAERVLRGANITTSPSCWTAVCGANTVVFDPKYRRWKRIRIRIPTRWCFSTVGISPGSWWAHHELGWGGRWFRDPVENASSMPRVLATARIHSVIIPKLNFWTSFLNMVTSPCCVLGTFFVRPGLLASVHSPATDSTRGIFLWCFFQKITSISLILFPQTKRPSSTEPVDASSDLLSNVSNQKFKELERLRVTAECLNMRLATDCMAGEARSASPDNLGKLASEYSPESTLSH